MSSNEYAVPLIHHQGGISEGIFILGNDDADECRLTLRYAGGEITTVAADYFEGLCQIRNQLEKEGVRPACFGSSQNVYPSSMSRDMGGGLKAYRLYLGQNARIEDLVEIFDTGPDMKPVTVDEQRAFYEDWLRSL
jgi:hypothetical protein